MAGDIRQLAAYRLEKAQRNLELAKTLFEGEMYGFALNRAYYGAFDAMRAVNALDSFDSSKHSGVISHFNQDHVKTGDFDPSVSTIIRNASRLRERSDYEDFYEPEKDEVTQTITEVESFIADVSTFLRNKTDLD